MNIISLFRKDRVMARLNGLMARIRREEIMHMNLIHNINRLSAYFGKEAKKFLKTFAKTYEQNSILSKEIAEIRKKLVDLITTIKNRPEEPSSIKEADLDAVVSMWAELERYARNAINYLSIKGSMNKEEAKRRLDELREHNDNINEMIKDIRTQLKDYFLDNILKTKRKGAA